MTDNEIIKALECCKPKQNRNCGDCPAYDLGDFCAAELRENALDLINHQRAEIKRLKEENQKLNLMVEAIDDYISPLPFKTDFDNAIETAKSEAIKEFAEKLKYIITLNNTNDSYLDYSVDYNCLMEDIDELVKEMVGENNDKL